MTVRCVGLVLSVLALLGGCATVPTESAPTVLGTVASDSAQPSAQAPIGGREPDLLVSDFVSAGASPGDRHATARQYLTGEADAAWDDSSRTTVLTGVDPSVTQRRADVVEVTLRGEAVGTLSAAGQFEVSDRTEPYETTMTLVQVGGQWRIDALPDGAVVDQSSFRVAYQRRPVYFLSPGLTTVVPDLRWVVNDPDSLPAQLVNLLVAGPAPHLAPAVTTYLRGDVKLRSNITTADGQGPVRVGGAGGVRIDFEGVGALDSAARQLLAAQVVWTLDAAQVKGPYVLLADGAPLAEQHPDGWTTGDVAATDPAAAPGAALGLHAVVAGALVSVTDAGYTAVPGALGGATTVESAAVSRSGQLVAAVQRRPGAGVQLVVGSRTSGVVVAAEGDTMTRPTFAADDSTVWVVQNGTTVLLASREQDAGAPVIQPVDTSDLGELGGPILALRLSRDGVRAALVAGGQVVVAVVTRTESGVVALSRPQRLAPSLAPSVTTLDWIGPDTLVVVRSEPDRPVVTVVVDGSQVQELPGNNLTAPVRAVAASSTAQIVADSRGVLQLGTSDSTGDRVWRDVPGLDGPEGPTALPVLPG